MTTTISRQDCLALPYTMTTESKARQFAQALETVFLEDISTEVIDDGGKWFVVVTDGMELASESEGVNLIDRIAVLLMSFDLAEYTSNVMPLQACYSRSEAVAAHEGLTSRARRQFRIEDKLDAILNILHGAENKATLTKSEGDAHRLPDGPRMSAVAK